ncbi:MAG: helix-turn-helix transcriptional regulator [Deltaproteobacteria bacterium]|jgi:transcriptional regulator with XRE-family HTH domain|nr:helix-turn-helix transcriptional regulator [Deltaproteobacteria bacterium]
MTTVRNKKIKYGLKELEKDFGPLTFGRLLEAHRLSEEISQTDMAKKLKISRQKLNDFENGRRFPSLRMSADMAKALGEHAPTWISVVIEEMLRDEDLDFKVTLAG